MSRERTKKNTGKEKGGALGPAFRPGPKPPPLELVAHARGYLMARVAAGRVKVVVEK